MRVINKNDLMTIIYGANFLGTGGGGTVKAAKSLLEKCKDTVNLVSLDDLPDDAIVCTVFGTGGKQKCDAIIASQKALDLFQQVYNRKVDAIIAVEVGPVSVATSLFIASQLDIPLLDSDIVGLRSSPEIYLETISLANLDRTPCAIADDKGNSAVITSSQNVEVLEKLLRGFATNVGGLAFTAGYPLLVKDIRNIVPTNSISLCQKIGEQINVLKNSSLSLDNFFKNNDLHLYGRGKITAINEESYNGFEIGTYTIDSSNKTFTVKFKNENIVLLENDQVILTVPDSIILFDIKKLIGINNFEDNENKEVAIIGKKAIPIWRTKKGKELFSPKKLGLEYEQILLK